MNARNGLAYRLLALVVLAASWAVAAEEPPVLKALVVFGKFKSELPGVDAPPAWAEDIFDPERPGSVSHFYDEMSFGQHRVRGEIAPRWYVAEQTFWAHDQDYARAHRGNLGDATDPFDGVRFRAFTPETNPNSDSQYGDSGVYLEDIQIADGMLSAQLTIPPLNIDVESVEWVDADRDGVFLAGEPVECVFALANIGLIGSDSLHVSLRSTDGSVIIKQQTTSYPALRADKTTRGPGSRGYPRFSFDLEIADGHTAEFVLEVAMGDEIVRRHALRATGSSPKVEIEQVAVIDTIGNGDGRVQRGEFVRLGLTLAPKRPEFFALATFSLRSVDEGVMLVGKPEVKFSPQSVPVTSKHNPEFLVRGDVAAGSSLEFEFATSTAYGTWEDTLVVRVSEGDDATPPRIGYPYFTISRDLLRVVVPTSELLDGSAIDSAWVVVHDAKNDALITEIPLRWDDGLWIGDWTGAAGQKLRLQLVAVDQHGNQGAGVLADAHIPPMAPADGGISWRAVGMRGLSEMRVHPQVAGLIYGRRDSSLYYSDNGLFLLGRVAAYVVSYGALKAVAGIGAL